MHGKRTSRFLVLTSTNIEWQGASPGQLSLLSYAGREMSAGQSVVMFCGWRVAGILGYPSLTRRANMERFRDE